MAIRHKIRSNDNGGTKVMNLTAMCLWCNEFEPSKKYRPGKNVDFICSSCVQLLCGCSQEKLRELQKTCQAKGYGRRLEALKSFVEVGHEQRNPKGARPNDRIGPLRTIRMQKKSTCTIKKLSLIHISEPTRPY